MQICINWFMPFVTYSVYTILVRNNTPPPPRLFGIIRKAIMSKAYLCHKLFVSCVLLVTYGYFESVTKQAQNSPIKILSFAI